MNSRSNAQTAATSPRAEPERPTRAVARASRDTTGPVIEVPYALITTATGEYEISGRVTDESEIAEVRFMGKVIVIVRSGRGMGAVKRISHVEAKPHKVLSFCW